MKALLLDVDGVILNKGEYFSLRFAREHGVPVELVTEFFKGPFVACQKGEADLKEEIVPYLEKWGWKGDAESFMKYWFESDFSPNEERIEQVRELRRNGVRCYIASNNEKYRAQYITEQLTKYDVVEGAFFSSDLTLRKDNPEFFRAVLRALDLKPADVTFIDNDERNVATARELGIDAREYHEGILTELTQNEMAHEFKMKIN